MHLDAVLPVLSIALVHPAEVLNFESPIAVRDGAANDSAVFHWRMPAQQPTAFTYYNGLAASFGYSADRLQLTSLSYAKSGTTLFGLMYSYGTSGSNDGLISSITDNAQSGRSVSYTYDSLARLSTALTTGSTAYPQWGLQWTYDRYANRTAQQVTAGTNVPSNTVTVSATTNRITGSPYAYDVSGNMTNDGLNTLIYDGENRSTSATNSGSSGAYTYDGGGMRVKKVSGSTTTVYVFSGSKVVAEYDNGAAPTSPSREYIYSGTTLIAKIDSAGTHYYHKDFVSNRLVTDSSGNVSAQLGHYPYGESWYNSTGDKLLFTTYERDSESGNDYAQARYYVSRLGRFSSVDPLSGSTGDPQSLNRYTYVRDLPTLLVDPEGTCDQSVEARRRKRRLEVEPSGMALRFYETEVMYADPAQDDAPNPIDCFDPAPGGGGNPAKTDPPLDPDGPPPDCNAGNTVCSDPPPDPCEVDPQFWCFPTPTGPLTPRKIKNIINGALKQAKLAECLNKFFGKGTILNNSNLPHIDGTQGDENQLGAQGTVQLPVPATGPGTVIMASNVMNNALAPQFAQQVYLHETANVLAYQTFTSVPVDSRPFMGPLGGPPTGDQQKQAQLKAQGEPKRRSRHWQTV